MLGIQVFIIIILLPFLAALGHDAWLYYEGGMEAFKLTSAGFLWTHYHPDSFKWAAENLGQGVWDVLNWLLPQKAVYITSVLPAVFCPLLLILYVFRLWPFDPDRGVYVSPGHRARTGVRDYRRK